MKSSNSVKVTYPAFNVEELQAKLRASLPELGMRLPLTRVVLFGSWASGRATAFSDIDLLVVYADPPRDDAYKTVCQSITIRGLEPHVYSEQEAAQLAPTLAKMTHPGFELL